MKKVEVYREALRLRLRDNYSFSHLAKNLKAAKSDFPEQYRSWLIKSGFFREEERGSLSVDSSSS